MYGTNQVHVITHADMDGLTAAAVVRQYHPDAVVIITNYKKQIFVSKFKPGDTVYVTDFSLSKDMFEIIQNEKRCRIIWIDHHKQTYENLQAEGWDCEGIRRDDHSGAMLTWLYFNPDKTPEQAPDFIKLVSWYDLWQHDKDPRIRAFAYGVGLWDIRPGYLSGDRFWNALFSNVDGDRMLNNIIRYGKDIQHYVETFHDTLCKDLAYRTTLHLNDLGDKNILAMAIRTGNSAIFERQDTSDIDALFIGQYVPGQIMQYRCSMYSPDNKKEILNIANHFGGGGHPTAAGFTVPKYPLNYPDRKKPIPLADAVKMYDDIFKLRCASPILMKYVDRSSTIGAKASHWYSQFCGHSAIVFNHQYIPELIPILPTAVECINPNNGEVAELYLGYVMTNSGLFRCCAYPTSTSIDLEKILCQFQQTYMKELTEDLYRFELINGGIWWYQPEEPVKVPINFNLQGSSVN